jgi:hypothetical protein
VVLRQWHASPSLSCSLRGEGGGELSAGTRRRKKIARGGGRHRGREMAATLSPIPMKGGGLRCQTFKWGWRRTGGPSVHLGWWGPPGKKENGRGVVPVASC